MKSDNVFSLSGSTQLGFIPGDRECPSYSVSVSLTLNLALASLCSVIHIHTLSRAGRMPPQGVQTPITKCVLSPSFVSNLSQMLCIASLKLHKHFGMQVYACVILVLKMRLQS
jgi:hypothetical protein